MIFQQNRKFIAIGLLNQRKQKKTFIVDLLLLKKQKSFYKSIDTNYRNK